jgi:hypothetical protein
MVSAHAMIANQDCISYGLLATNVVEASTWFQFSIAAVGSRPKAKMTVSVLDQGLAVLCCAAICCAAHCLIHLIPCEHQA